MKRRYDAGGLAVGNGEDETDESGGDVMDAEGDESTLPDSTTGGLSSLGFDVPGAAEAFSMMASSSKAAREALQQARESIMKRHYSKADAWLAASAALGAPTRTGSFAESFGNLSGALRQPLAARQQFDIQKDKDLLGVNTQLAGLDEREATARLALAQLNAKLRAQMSNAPNNIIVGADGLPRYTTRQDARGKQAYVAPSAATNINVSADKSLYGKMAEQLGAEYVDQYKTAQNAQTLVDRNQQIQELLKANPYTGAGAEWKVKFGKAAKTLGFDYAGDDITNTERLFSSLGNNILESIHGSGLGTGNGFTNKDLDFLTQVKGGSINLDSDTIAYLSELSDRTARLSTDKWNRTYSLLKPDLLKELGLTPIKLRTPGAMNAAAGMGAAPEAPAAPAIGADQPAAEAPAADSAGAPRYGIAPAQWAVDPANPPPRAPPAAEKALKEHPEKRQEFVDKFGYLPGGG